MIKFGDIYTAEGAEPRLLVDALAVSAPPRGFAVSQRSDAGVVSVELAQVSPWYVVLLRALPQRLRCDVWVEGETTFLRLDRWTLPWYRSATVALCIVAAALFWVSWHAALAMDGSRAAYLGIGGLFVCMGMAFLCWRLSAAGAGCIARLREDLHAHLRNHGVLLEHRPELSRSRLARSARRYLVFVVVVAAGAVIARDDALGPVLRADALLVIVPLVLVAVLLCGIVRASIRRPGFDSRVTTVLPGLSGMFLALFVLIAQLPGHLLAQFDDEAWTAMFIARDLLAETPPSVLTVTTPSGNVTARAELARAVSGVQWLTSVTLLFPLFCWGIGLLGMWSSLRSVDLCYAQGHRLKEWGRLLTVRQATSGAGFLGLFRVMLLTVWMVCAGINTSCAIALFRAGATAAYGVPRGWTSGHQDVAGACAHALKYSIGLSPDSVSAEVASRVFWCLWTAVVLAALVASGLSWVWTRHRAYRHLLERSRAAPVVLARTAREIGELVGRRVVRPWVAVLPLRSPAAASFEFGLIRRRQMVAVTEGALDLLDESELRALLAHEIGHLALGHCRTHAVLQLLGRLTFVGDSFVGALEHSFGYELAADRMAVERLGVGSSALRSCLQKICAVSTFGRLPEQLDQGLPVDGGRFGMPPSGRFTLRRSLRLWFRFYTADTLLAYWHPTIEDRLRALDSSSHGISRRSSPGGVTRSPTATPT